MADTLLPIEEIRAFYEPIEPRAEEASRFCSEYALDDLPGEARSLAYLLCSLMETSFLVECWRQPRVPDAGAWRVDYVLQPLR
jgi:hypothetical protein